MFVVLAYDVNQKRTGKVMKICRKYLVHIQKSVFEGAITEQKLNALKRELRNIIDFDEDSICIYSTKILSNLEKEQLGVVESHPHII